jgi:hypothetical protein
MTKASTLIGSGFIASALGGTSLVAGNAANAAEVVRQYAEPAHPGMGWVVIGLILAASGVIALAWGFWKLATDVEYLVAQTTAGAPKEDAPAEAS